MAKLELNEYGEVVIPNRKISKKDLAYAESLKGITLTNAKKIIIDQKKKIDRYENGATCYICGALKLKTDFYTSTDPVNKSGICPICKECARKIALRVDRNGEEHAPTKESVQEALKYLNKPWLDSVWNSSVQQYQSLIGGNVPVNIWNVYIRMISMVNYNGMTYFD